MFHNIGGVSAGEENLLPSCCRHHGVCCTQCRPTSSFLPLSGANGREWEWQDKSGWIRLLWNNKAKCIIVQVYYCLFVFLKYTSAKKRFYLPLPVGVKYEVKCKEFLWGPGKAGHQPTLGISGHRYCHWHQARLTQGSREQVPADPASVPWAGSKHPSQQA